ncbi:MAG: hypothetical protein EXX96DRAFT_540786 [Benjaminiella poitrasii]|nr:MAG: hypothetical protein EXX96DRAFT_540786 [Benjaminiella poitrasii]
MELRLINMINSSVEKRKNLQDLKKEQLAIKRLPKGLVTDTEDAAGCPPTTLEKLLKRKKKRSLIFWFDFIETSFEAVCNKVTNPQIETSRAESSKTVVSKSSSKPDEIFRTCTTSINTILRADITGNVKNIFFNKINKAIEESSDYTLKLSIVLFATMLSFKSHSFIINDRDNVKIQPSAGAQLSSFFPSDFQNTDAVKKDPTPLTSLSFPSISKVKKYFQTLFSQEHLQHIHSYYFGAKGITKGSLEKNPVRSLLFQLIQKEALHGSKSDSMPASIMSTALSQYGTNFPNMWADKKIFLKVLLRIHLAPNRYKAYLDFVESKQKEILAEYKKRQCLEKIQKIRSESAATEEWSFRQEIQAKRKGKQRMSHVEQTRTEKLQKIFNKYDERHAFYLNKFKAEVTLFIKGKEKATSVSIKGKQAIREETKRKNIDKGLPEDDSTTSDGEKINMEGDLPGKCLNALKSVLRRLLLDKKRTHSLTKDDFERGMKDIKEPELKVCLKISSRLLPYILSADTFNFVVYQLPFVHLANDLRYPVVQEKHVQYVLQFQYLRYSR